MSAPLRVAVVGAGWAGLAASVATVQAGHALTLFEAGRCAGGRARTVPLAHSGDGGLDLDNGQHILIGAYTDTLALMKQVGVDPGTALLRLPLALRFPDGDGLQLPDLPPPWDALAGMARARGWHWRDKLALLGAAARWRLQGFVCPAHTCVADLCAALPQRLQAEFIEPLCVAALNTPAAQASGQVFLRVLHDSLFSGPGSSHLLLPRVPLGALLPEAALRWLARSHAGAPPPVVRLGTRVLALYCGGGSVDGPDWRLRSSAGADEAFDRVILAVSASESARVLMGRSFSATNNIANAVATWVRQAQALRFEAIATVYGWARQGGQATRLPLPMMALRASAAQPAQFVFDRGQLGGPAGLQAWVVSASQGERLDVQQRVVAQAQAQCGVQLQPLQTVVEKRATFACTPALVRPPMHIAPGLLAAGDYVHGPYPATLEGAVRSGLAAARHASTGRDAPGEGVVDREPG